MFGLTSKRLQLRVVDAKPETGEANAQRFVNMVTRVAHDNRVVICYPHGKPTLRNECLGWQWMQNPEWRARVLALLEDKPVRGAAFCPPDSLDGWTFHAYSTVPVPRIAQLSLSETL